MATCTVVDTLPAACALPMPLIRTPTGSWAGGATISAPQSFSPLPPNTDFMGYCENRWVSDYTFSALFERGTIVNSLARSSARSGAQAARRAYRFVDIGEDGQLTIGEKVMLAERPQGRPMRFMLRGTAGEFLKQTVGFGLDQSHSKRRSVLIEEPDAATREIEYEGRREFFRNRMLKSCARLKRSWICGAATKLAALDFTRMPVPFLPSPSPVS